MDAFALDQQGISLYLSVLFYIAIRNSGAIGGQSVKNHCNSEDLNAQKSQCLQWFLCFKAFR